MSYKKSLLYEIMWSYIKSPFVAIRLNDNRDVMFYGKFIVKIYKSFL